MTRWSVVVSDETDKALRVFLAEQGGGKKGELSTFIEDAVRKRLFELTVHQVKQQNAEVTPEEIMNAIDEAVQEVRASRT